MLEQVTSYGEMVFVFNIDVLVPDNLEDLRLKTFTLGLQYEDEQIGERRLNEKT